jgi:hypothetical protein
MFDRTNLRDAAKYLGVLLSAALGGGAVSLGLSLAQGSPAFAGDGTVLRAERFEVVDAAGIVRAQLGQNSEGMTGLSIFDLQGNTRVAMQQRADGLGLFSIQSAKGEVLAKLGTAPDDRSVLWLFGPNGEMRMALMGEPGALQIHDPAERLRAQLVVAGDGPPTLRLYDAEARVRAGLGLGADGSPLLVYFDEDGDVDRVLGP